MAAITITGSSIQTGELTMSDHGNSKVKKGEKVTWIIGPHSGVKSIEKIMHCDNSMNVFFKDPGRVGNGRASNWQGIVSKEVADGSVEEYYIDWKDTEGKLHKYDPKITVNQ